MKNPTQCHLWQKEHLAPEDLRGCFETVEEYLDDSHHMRRLVKCRTCGQLYFYEFYEWIDWTGGNDPQYVTYIPVESQEEIEALKKTDEFTILNFTPQLHKDFPRDATEPKVYWVGR